MDSMEQKPMRETLRRRQTLSLLLAAFVILPGAALAQGTVPAAAGSGGQSAQVRQLSMDEAVQFALEQNLNLQVQRLDPQIQDLSLAQVRTAWTPTFNSTLLSSSSTSPITNVFAGATNQLTNDNLRANFGVGQLLPWGANYNVSWNNSRGESNSIYDSPNPFLQSNLNLAYNQPLLRNFKIDGTRQQLLITEKNREMTDIQLRQAILTTTRAVKSAYWDLAYAIGNLKVQQQSLDIARQSLQDNKSRVNIGTMAPIDIIEAQAEVARNEEAVIVAEAQITRAEDVLRALIFDPKNPEFWAVQFDLTERPAFKAQAVDVDSAVKNALSRRTDLEQQRKNLEATDINIRYYRNQTLPDLNVQAGYGLTGQGGTVYDFTDTFPPQLLSSANTPYTSVLSRMLGNDFHNWSLAVTVGYPIGRSTAEAGLARAKVSYSQSVLQLRQAELQVATQVREVARQLNTNQKRVDATRASRELAEKKLEAQQKKFAAGMSTNFEVIQAQRDLAAARNSELQALLDFNRSQVDFDTVQQAPVGGSVASGFATAASVQQAATGGSTATTSGSGRQ
jgi:outer membrane protein TolC